MVVNAVRISINASRSSKFCAYVHVCVRAREKESESESERPRPAISRVLSCNFHTEHLENHLCS